MISRIFALADGEPLTLRPPTANEISALIAFVSDIHDSPALGAWLRDALSGRHPAMARDCVICAVTADGQLTGAVALIPQRWQYGTVTLPIGQLEAISVAPAYRRRGVARALITAAHQLSRRRGHLLQAIVGQPHLYRRFGYTYALRFRGGRALTLENAPPPPAALIVRPAASVDIPALMALNAVAGDQLHIRTQLDTTRWQYDLSGHSPDSDAALRIDLVCTADGTPHGYARSFPAPWDGELTVTELACAGELSAEISATLTAAWRARFGPDLTSIAWELDEAHPLFTALNERLSPPRRPSAWYLHAPDLPALLAHISPVLLARLSAAATELDRVTISTFGGGVTIAKGQARLTVTPWAGEWHEADAAFPAEALLQLITGYRGLAELLDCYPDVLVSQAAAPLLEILFPRRPSHVVPLG